MRDRTKDLDRLQQDIAGRIAADAGFDDVPVIAQAKGVIEEDISESLGYLTVKGGKMGVCVVVQLPARSVPKPNIPGPDYALDCPIVIVENALMNRCASGTGKTATALSLMLEHLLHQVSFGAITLYAGNAVGGQYVDQSGAPIDGVQQYEVTLHGNWGMDAARLVQTPRITLAGAVATITCGTPASTVRYTLDGSYPGASAAAYAAPVTLTDGQTIRAVAYADGYQASSLAETIYTATTNT